MFKLIIAVAALAVLTTHPQVAARSRQSRQAKNARWWDNGHLMVARSRPIRQASSAPWWETIGDNPEVSEVGQLSAAPAAPASLTSGPASSIVINDLSDLASLFGGGVNQPGADCECVPYYQCKEGVIITDGEGVIDIREDAGSGMPVPWSVTVQVLRNGSEASRFGNTLNDTGNTRLNSHSQCQNFLDVCCQHPNTAVIPGPGPVDQYLAKCGRRNPTGVNARVSGFTATQAQFGEFPWMAAILQTEFVGDEEVHLYVCGGSLIYPDVVLTAAHCVQSWQNTPTVLKVRLGEWDTQRTYELYTHVDRRVSKVIANDKYNPGSLSNDFAILLLETPVALTPHIDTVCLPDVYPNVEPTKCFVTGWGKNEFGKEGEFQNILKKVSLPLVSHSDCEKAMRTTRLGKYFNLHSTFTCAGGGVAGQDACNGDGGSPLVCPLLNDHATYVQVGIVAWGIGCGEAGIPGVYADVTKGITWVNQELAKLPYSRIG